MRDYQRERIRFHLQRQRHAREAPSGCRCVYCLTTEQIEAAIRAQIERERALIGEPPF